MKRIIGIMLAVCLLANTAFADAVVDKLQGASVTINAHGSQGSGVLVTRKVGDNNITFVLTAGHVIDHLKKTRTVIVDGKDTKRIEFDDVNMVQEFQQGGRRVGSVNTICRVIRYSDAELGEDLAVLQVYKYNFTTATTDFYTDEAIPAIGTDLYHVGSLRGQVGSNSLTTGIISQTGRVLDLSGGSGVIFDQTTATAFPGSSGGGVYLKADGRHIGVLVRGAGEGFNFIVPARRLNGWCKAVNIPWLVDTKAKMPSLEDIEKLVPNDISDVREAGMSRHFSEESLKYPTLISNINPPLPSPTRTTLSVTIGRDHGAP